MGEMLLQLRKTGEMSYKIQGAIPDILGLWVLQRKHAQVKLNMTLITQKDKLQNREAQVNFPQHHVTVIAKS